MPIFKERSYFISNYLYLFWASKRNLDVFIKKMRVINKNMMTIMVFENGHFWATLDLFYLVGRLNHFKAFGMSIFQLTPSVPLPLYSPFQTLILLPPLAWTIPMALCMAWYETKRLGEGEIAVLQMTEVPPQKLPLLATRLHRLDHLEVSLTPMLLWLLFQF